MFLRFLLLLIFGIGLIPTEGEAHRKDESYVYLNVGDTSLSGRYEFNIQDFDQVLKLDDDGDGVVTQDEFDAHKDEIYEILQPGLVFSMAGQEYPIALTGHTFSDVGIGIYALVNFETDIAQALPEAIDVRYTPYFREGGATLPVLLIIESNERSGMTGNEARHSLIFTGGSETRSVDLTGGSSLKLFGTFVVYGYQHILIGYDHLLFLLALLLPAVLVVQNRTWVPVGGLRAGVMNVLTVVTLFTIAHSITFSLAALEVVRLPERLVESLIAASIAVAAAANLFAIQRAGKWIVIVGFGLLHGLGFANVLSPLGVDPSNLFVTLFGFNIGVEVGQVAFVLVCFPVLFLIRKTRIYVPVFLYGGSLLLTLIALYWFAKRAFDLEFSLSAILF